MDKNTSHESKSNQLYEVLSRNIEKNGSIMNDARIKLIAQVIIILCKVQTVSFHKLALAFDNESKADSSLRRIQRSMSRFHLCSDLIAKLIYEVLFSVLRILFLKKQSSGSSILIYLRILVKKN